MLLSAQAKRREGVDVVVGIVETHGRRETEALLDGLEIIPRQQVEYKGHRLAEMDLDAILKRRPQLVLVDELAHTNAPGCRHPKRYLDVEELIAAGIDVFTTLNIQHVESLNDVVAQITRIRVRETVPDSVLDQADDIEVIDLSPDDLIKRLHEGKVYVPQQAERAVRHYLLDRQSDGAARAGVAAHRAARRRAAAVAYARARDRRAVAGRRARAGLRQRGAEHGRADPLRAARRRPAARCRGPRSMSRPRAPSGSTMPSATASPTTCGWPSGSARRRSPSPAATSPTS